MEIKIKYHNPELIRIGQIAVGNWIDLRAAEDVILEKGEYRLISLGVSMKLPEGYEAWVAPRSSTFKTWGLILANHVGIIDNSYSGTNDIWKFSALAMRDTEIHVNDRICQFRVVPVMGEVTFRECDELDSLDRGGFGSTGKR
ncbi:MAG: deoxyuridine 5'-triphosphate nucleotidohydrolase [Oscillospiraceae bacterium]|jgi:dUTP pyrophosphatase|nr:deoxyuridine 5'-triphosphate nucleotidohydrolase [Oscillospiraceae bacterium]